MREMTGSGAVAGDGAGTGLPGVLAAQPGHQSGKQRKQSSPYRLASTFVLSSEQGGNPPRKESKKSSLGKNNFNRWIMSGWSLVHSIGGF